MMGIHHTLIRHVSWQIKSYIHTSLTASYGKQQEERRRQLPKLHHGFKITTTNNWYIASQKETIA